MANKVTLGGDGEFFVGEDKELDLEVLDTDEIPVNITGWAVRFDVRAKSRDADPPVITKTASISGTYNATRATNTQRAVVTLTDDDTNLLAARTYSYTFKRTDAGYETVLAYGALTVEQPAVR